MRHISFVPLKDSIATQLLKAVFAFYLILVLTVTSLHMVAEYAHTKEGVLHELKSLERTVKPGLDQALWEMNLPQMHFILAGISELPEIVGACVRDDRGNVIEQIGLVPNPAQAGNKGIAETGAVSGMFWHEFPLLYTRGDRTFTLGRAAIYSNFGVVFQRLRFGFFLMIISAFVQIVAFWMLFLWISRKKLSLPLAELTHAAGRLDLDNLEKIEVRLHVSGRNELNILEDTFNAMIQKLLAAREKLRDLNQTLRRHQDELEQRVRERTAALGKSEAELRALFAGMTDVVLMMDSDGRYLKIAPTCPELLYKPAGEMIGKTLHEVFPKDQADFFLEHIRRCLETHSLVSLEYSMNVDGRELWFDGRIFPMSDDTAVFVARDMTERKQFETKLRHAKEIAEIANNAKSVFLAAMSHELRTPLNAVLGYAKILSGNRNFTDDEKKNVDAIIRNGENLLSLINDILEFSKIETDRVVLQPVDFDLHHMLGDLISMFRPEAERKGLELGMARAPGLPRHVRADRDKLLQILINLLNNAIKYTDKGNVELRCSDFQTLNESRIRLCFEVSDTGIGIESGTEKIFNAFSRIDERQYNQGAGLGLAVCRKYVRMMGGEIGIESVAGKGSTFSFDIMAELADGRVVPVRKTGKSLEPESIFRERDLSDATFELPSEWVAELVRGAEDVDVELLDSVIARIRIQDASLADALESLVGDFDYDGILKLLQAGTGE